MRNSIRVTALAMAAVLMTTGLASALERLGTDDSVRDSLDKFGERSLHVVRPNNEAVNDVVKPHNFNVKAINDAVLGRDKATNPKLKLVLKSGHLLLKCSTGGDDLLVSNLGEIDLPAGTRLKWKVKAMGEQGVATLKRGLGSGEKVRLTDLLDDKAQKGTNCSAKVSGF
jgi:hypothetical protein